MATASNNFYKRFFDQSVIQLKNNSCQKLKDSNTARTNYNNPHYRCLVVSNVPRLTFAYLYGKNFKPDEVKVRSYNHLSSSLFSISTLNRLQEIFPVEALVKVNSHRDTTVICPFGYIDADMSIKFPNDKYGTFEAGKLFIPIKADGDNILAFFFMWWFGRKR